MKVTASVILCVFVLFAPAPVHGQARATGADLTGLAVADASGGVLPGSTVTVTNRATNVTRTVTTNAAGQYVVPALPPGTYTVWVSRNQFATATRENSC